MSDKIEAVIKIQSLIRGSLYRKGINHKSRCMEFRLMNILTNLSTYKISNSHKFTIRCL